MSFYLNGINLHSNSYIPKNNVIATDNNVVLVSPYTYGLCMLDSGEYTYRQVFDELGVTNDAIDACCDHALKLIKDNY